MNVDQAADERWRDSTDGFERVKAVLRQTREPATAAAIAERAAVSETTARKHLETLIELGAAATAREGRTTRYERNEEFHIVRRIQELQREHTRAELLDAIREMKAKLARYREEYGADSPEELALDLEGRELLDSGDGPSGAVGGEPWDGIADWRSTRQNLAFAQTALSYKRTRELVEA